MYDWRRRPPYRFVDEPLADSCNVEVRDQNDRDRRACRLPPKEVGERGRLLCGWHLRVDRGYLDWLDQIDAVERVAARLGALLACSASAGIPPWDSTGVPPDPPSVILEMSVDQAARLALTLDPRHAA
jgi:hypothetical protein